MHILYIGITLRVPIFHTSMPDWSDPEVLTWIFFLGGLILMTLEIFVPGGVSLFLGVGALITGVLRLTGLLEAPGVSVLTWLGISTVLTIALGPFLRRYFGGESSYKVPDEDLEAMDKVVPVLHEIDNSSNEGRIRFRGSSWRARTLEGTIPAGEHARIKFRDNLTWIVEEAPPPLDESDTATRSQLRS